HSIIIINTNKSRALADSKYNERRNECEQAIKDLQTELNITNLCELDPNTFEKHKALIENPTTQKRARHIVYENDRTLKALKKLNLTQTRKKNKKHLTKIRQRKNEQDIFFMRMIEH